ncbi:MAG TPA: hypothetical protein VHL30_03730, partial [Chlamydiales bacterium]|nr:hypothetical protein [Chlamydiales bacterium]
HDQEIAERNLKPLIEEMRLNIQAVYRARYIASLKSISIEQRNGMIKENLSKILNIPKSDFDRSLFDQMQQFLMKLGREEKMNEIQKAIVEKTQARPKAFDRGMFAEMTYFTILFKDQFAFKRDSRHISRVIALHYLFKKALLDTLRKSPSERHVRFKVYKTKLNGEQNILGILFAINILRESERMDKQFILDAIHSCLPLVDTVKDSYLFDQREKKLFLAYLEIHKPSFEPFRIEEIKLLRQKLGTEIKKQIENDVHPIFLPRNEEEIARNLILLSQQLRYNRDLPQVSIHYEKQSESELFFSILMARLLLPTAKGLRELIVSGESELKLSIDEIREIGKLKRKIPKEASMLCVALDKAPFFRPDYSVDLLRARQKVAYELSKVIGEYRDFNGGMILKQEESLLSLRSSLGTMSQEIEFLLENYFYSLRPGIMQTVLPTEVLNAHFGLLIHLRKNPNCEVLEKKTERFFLFFGRINLPGLKENIEIAVERLKIPSYELTSCSLQFPARFSVGPPSSHYHSSIDLLRSPMDSAIGYIYRSETPEAIERLQEAIQQAIGLCKVS